MEKKIFFSNNFLIKLSINYKKVLKIFIKKSFFGFTNKNYLRNAILKFISNNKILKYFKILLYQKKYINRKLINKKKIRNIITLEIFLIFENINKIISYY